MAYWLSVLEVPKVRKFLDDYQMVKYNFHGCMLGTCTKDGVPLKKPWTVATTIPELGMSLMAYQCDGTHEHAEGRGKDLKSTELYTWALVDEVHVALQPLVPAKIALPCVKVKHTNMTIPQYIPASQQDADAVVERMDSDKRAHVFDMVRYWEKRMVEMRVGAIASTFEDSTDGVQMMGGSQQPIVDLVEALISTDNDHTFRSYPDLIDVLQKVPPYYFGVAESRPEGLVDLLVLGDSTTALVAKPGDFHESSRIPFGDLIKNIGIPGIGKVYSRLCWGRGLNTIVNTAREALDEILLENFYAGNPGRKVLVLVGWSGNDVHGDFGYQGCTWIHQSRYLKSDADRKVAAEWPAKQKARVDQSIKDLVALKEHDAVFDILVFGNGHHEEYGLPPSYNQTLGKRFQELVDAGINTVSFEIVSMRGYRYDRVHLDDSSLNRNLVTRYLKGLITFHLIYREIMDNSKVLLETADKLLGGDLTRRMHYVHTTPNLMQLRRALEKTPEVQKHIQLNDCVTHATPAEDCDAKDREIFEWIQAAWEEAEQEAIRKDAPKGELFSQEERVSFVPVNMEDEDSDCEAERIRVNIADDIKEAVLEGYSIVEMEDVAIKPEEDSEKGSVDLTNWVEVPEPGIENEFDKISLTTEESIVLDDEVNVEEVESFTAGSVTLKSRDDAAMNDDTKEEDAVMTDAGHVEEETKKETEKEEKKEEKHAGRPVEKPKGSAPTRPKETISTDLAAEKLQKAAEMADERVWLDPDDLAPRIPYKNINNSGRYLQISKKLSYFLRGHPLEYGLPCPEFNPLDLSVEWEDLMSFMRQKIWQLEDWEVLQVVRSSDSRRFQVQVAKPDGEKATWKGLPWKPVACRTFQGHNRALMKQSRISALVKEIFTLDPEYGPQQLDCVPPQWPRFNMKPYEHPMFEKFPRVIYHSCDIASVDEILKTGLIPGGWPKSSGRPHNYFINMPPWHANMRKLAGTRAGKPMYVAFDVELMIQHGCRVFQTDQAILCSDWVPNECIICVYDAGLREFYHVNRAYPSNRKHYNEKIKFFDGSTPALVPSLLTELNKMADDNFTSFRDNVGRGHLRHFQDTVKEVTGIIRENESKYGQTPVEVKGYSRAPFMGVSYVPQLRKNASRKGWSKGKAKGKGKESRDYEIDRDECVVSPMLKIPLNSCRACGQYNLDGHHKCFKCRAMMEEATDINLATEVARLESFAIESYGTFALDQVTTIQPRSQRVRGQDDASSSTSTTKRGGRSNYGVLRDQAVNYRKKMIKGQFQNLTDRLEQDPFFQFNAAQNQLTPPCLRFIERLASSIAPDFSRTAAARTGGKGTDIKTRLVFVPFVDRQFDHAIDVTYESMIAHHGRFFSLAQFAVYAGTVLNARGEPSPVLHGWNDMEMAVDLSPELNLADLTNFRKRPMGTGLRSERP